MHKRAKELHSDQGTRKFEARLEYSRQRARRVTVSTPVWEMIISSDLARCRLLLLGVRQHHNMKKKAAIWVPKHSLIPISGLTFSLVGQSANKVVGYAWRSVDVSSHFEVRKGD